MRPSRFKRAWKKALSVAHYITLAIAIVLILLTEFSAVPVHLSAANSKHVVGDFTVAPQEESHRELISPEEKEAPDHNIRGHEQMMQAEASGNRVRTMSSKESHIEHRSKEMAHREEGVRVSRGADEENWTSRKIEHTAYLSKSASESNALTESSAGVDGGEKIRKKQERNFEINRAFSKDFGAAKLAVSSERDNDVRDPPREPEKTEFLRESGEDKHRTKLLPSNKYYKEPSAHEAPKEPIKKEGREHLVPEGSSPALHSRQPDPSPPENNNAISTTPAGAFRGVLQPASDPTDLNSRGRHDNVTQISYMLYRLVKTHRIASMADIPCIHNLKWMPALLHQIEFDTPGFRFLCIVCSAEESRKAQKAFGHGSSAEIVVIRQSWRSKLPEVDLAFLWNIVGFMTPQRSWGLIKRIRRSGTKYILLPNYPEVRNNPAAGTHHGQVNVRRAPYRFTESLRIFSNVSTDADTSKQMLLYDTERLREHDI